MRSIASCGGGLHSKVGYGSRCKPCFEEGKATNMNSSGERAGITILLKSLLSDYMVVMMCSLSNSKGLKEFAIAAFLPRLLQKAVDF